MWRMTTFPSQAKPRNEGDRVGAGPPLTYHPPSYWLRLFSSQTFSRINTPAFLKRSLPRDPPHPSIPYIVEVRSSDLYT